MKECNRVMYSPIDISEYIIKKSMISNQTMNQLKLQKLLYYIQANFLVKEDRRIFKEPIVAWRFGPVVERVYRKYSKYGSMNLYPDMRHEYTNLDEKDRVLVDEILDKYSDVSAWDLVEQTHKEDPWISTKQSCEIDTCKIKKYYSGEGKGSICR